MLLTIAALGLQKRYIEKDDTADGRRSPQANKGDDKKMWTPAFIVVVFILGTIDLVIGVVAATYSWKSNALAGWSPASRVIYAFIAFLFGMNYLLSHLIHKADLVSVVKRCHGEPTAKRANTNTMTSRPMPPLLPMPPVIPISNTRNASVTTSSNAKTNAANAARTMTAINALNSAAATNSAAAANSAATTLPRQQMGGGKGLGGVARGGVARGGGRRSP